MDTKTPKAKPKTITFKQTVAANTDIIPPLSFDYIITWERGKYNGI